MSQIKAGLWASSQESTSSLLKSLSSLATRWWLPIVCFLVHIKLSTHSLDAFMHSLSALLDVSWHYRTFIVLHSSVICNTFQRILCRLSCVRSHSGRSESAVTFLYHVPKAVQGLRRYSCGCRLLVCSLDTRNPTVDQHEGPAESKQGLVSQGQSHGSFSRLLSLAQDYSRMVETTSRAPREKDESFNEVLQANLLAAYSRALLQTFRLAKGKAKRGGHSSVVTGKIIS